MPVLVMKFGGTSVATLDRIRRAAKRVGVEVAKGYDVIVIVSAMSGKTVLLVGTYDTKADELDFLARFALLPFNAQCAFVRLANRRGYVFDLEKLDYAEIEDLPSAWSTLAGERFTETVSPALLPEWFERLTRPELVRLLDEADGPVRFRRSSKKAELVRVALERVVREAPGELVERSAGLLAASAPGQVVFVHSLHREAAYAGLPYGERGRLHRALGDLRAELEDDTLQTRLSIIP